ncbi:MAG: DUF1593 domain-containing protein [Prosthecobacter sp.]|nr:DUF1593 domain-containing protein [Prosthecobacter sp.]
MKTHLILACTLALLTLLCQPALAERPRLAVLTDIGGDPDDQQSMIRIMAYANEFEIEALIATAQTSHHFKAENPVTKPELIREIVDAYGKVLPNLQKHAQGWPSAADLNARIFTGNPRAGRKFIGKGHDTEGSRKLVELMDAGSAQRPLNIAIWGGQTDLAQALWSAKNGRDSDGWRVFTRKFRVYDVGDQDAIADWICTEFPGMFYILAKAPEGRDKREGIYRGMYLNGDESLTSRDWVKQHVLSAGPLGALYPTKTYTAPNKHGCLKEGDTPSWFFFLPLGGNDPNDPSKPGWGGQFQREDDGWWRDVPGRDGFDPRTVISQHRPAFQADFAKRMSWCRP